jgi:hypothetical protein
MRGRSWDAQLQAPACSSASTASMNSSSDRDEFIFTDSCHTAGNCRT